MKRLAIYVFLFLHTSFPIVCVSYMQACVRLLTCVEEHLCEGAGMCVEARVICWISSSVTLLMCDSPLQAVNMF